MGFLEQVFLVMLAASTLATGVLLDFPNDPAPSPLHCTQLVNKAVLCASSSTTLYKKILIGEIFVRNPSFWK